MQNRIKISCGDGMKVEDWERIADALATRVGKDAYSTWLKPVEFGGLETTVLSLNCPTGFSATWVERNFTDDILTTVKEAEFDVSRVHYAVKPANKSIKAPIQHIPAAPKDTAKSPLPSSPLDSRFTFDRFVVGKPNELAYAAAQRVSKGGESAFNPLFLYGGVGLGKTHLMHAIAHEAMAVNPEARVLYLSAEQFMYKFVQALRQRSMMDFKEMFRSVDMLMVDDVQFISGKDSTQDEFFHTFNALIDQKKQIVISADRAPGEIENLEERIKSRLHWGLAVDLHPTDYELRLGILQSKAEQNQHLYPDVNIMPGVLEFLAHRVSSNVRVLEGALTRLYAFGAFVGREVTLEAAQECLSDILRMSQRKVTIEEIIRKVSDHYNLRMTDMLSPRRARVVARPRQIAMYLSKILTTKSLPDIGRRFGGRDHTTVIHAVRKIEELKDQDHQIAEDIEILRRMLEA